jgi:transposase
MPRLGNWRIEKQNAPFEEAVSLLAEIPGFDRTTAWAAIAEIGINMKQFPSADELASWAVSLSGAAHSGLSKRLDSRPCNASTR